MASEKLQKLIAQRKALEERIKQEQNRENAKKRKADTRRKILAVAAVLDEAEKLLEFRKELYKLLDSFLTRSDDRAMFGLTVAKEERRAEGGKKDAPDKTATPAS